jgi:cysteine desulfurase/selenocysteine lyase
MSLDLQKIRKDFPILSQKVNGKPLVYFDNAATTQKPKCMIDALGYYYSNDNANIHRGVHTLSQRATKAFDDTRTLVARTYGSEFEEVIFTKGDTESLNLISYSISSIIDFKKTNIVITDLEHHSNIVPWQLLKARQKSLSNDIELRFANFTKDGFIDIESLLSKIDSNTKIVGLNWCSNTFGVINPIEEIIYKIREKNSQVIIVIDAAQSVPHKVFNFKNLDADFISFSGHKLCGPTGLGVLIGRKSILERMDPFMGGGDMIREVGWDQTTYNDLPYKFEAGTPNIADVIAFKSSLDYLLDIGFENIYQYERELASYLLESLNKLNFVEIYGADRMIDNKISLVSFNIKGVHAHDVGTLLDEEGIAVRTGHHCTQLIMKKLDIPATVRASLYIYNTKDEIDIMVERLAEIYKLFN